MLTIPRLLAAGAVVFAGVAVLGHAGADSTRTPANHVTVRCSGVTVTVAKRSHIVATVNGEQYTALDTLSATFPNVHPDGELVEWTAQINTGSRVALRGGMVNPCRE